MQDSIFKTRFGNYLVQYDQEADTIRVYVNHKDSLKKMDELNDTVQVFANAVVNGVAGYAAFRDSGDMTFIEIG